MNRCPITYLPIESHQRYSEKGLKLLSPQLSHLKDLPYSAADLLREAALQADKMSIQGVQPKLSAKLNIKQACFEFVDRGGRYIFKPPHQLFPQVPENEDLTMKLAAVVDIETPVHGLVYGKDQALTYFIKRFDREKQKSKLSTEDFSQLSNHSRETKYHSSMEQVVSVIDQYCTFPVLEKAKLFNRTVFCFLTGNEDMHLKNFSLISRRDKIELSPAYDLLNTSIIMIKTKEEMALPLDGKKRNFNRQDFVEYYGLERMKLNQKIINAILEKLEASLSEWERLIQVSFLSDELKEQYQNLVSERAKRIF